MTDKELPEFEANDEEIYSPRMAALKRRRKQQNNGEDYPRQLRDAKTETETIDLNSLAEETSKVQRSFNPQNIPGSKLGMLLDALPVPAMLIDISCNIVFSNDSCDKIAGGQENIRVGPFADLFLDPLSAEKAAQLIEEVFSKRKTQITEAMLLFGEQKIWGRIHLRSLRMGNFKSVLVLVEDLTPVKKELHLNRLDKADLERQLAKHVQQLQASEEALNEEIAKRELAETKLSAILESLGTLISILKEENDPHIQAEGINKTCALLADKIQKNRY
jgi:hypothetical protein